MKEYIQIIYKQEIQRMKAEILREPCDGSGGEFTRDLSINFDRSTRQGEAIVIAVRFVKDDWCIVQRLIIIDVCVKSVKADGLALVLNKCLSVEYSVRADSLMAATRDGASVNQAALNRIQFIFPKTFNVVCFTHTLDNVANHFGILDLSEFGNLWICLFGHSLKARLIWQEQTGLKSKFIFNQAAPVCQDLANGKQDIFRKKTTFISTSWTSWRKQRLTFYNLQQKIESTK